MQPKTITVPFDQKNFLDNQRAIWSIAYSKFNYWNQIFTMCATIFFVFDIIIQGDRSFFGVLVIGGYLFYCVMKWAGYFEKRFKFMKRRKLLANRYEKEDFRCFYTFTENHVEYRDAEKFYQFSWSVFNPYSVYYDGIVLTAKDSEGIVMRLSKKQIGEQDYNEVRYILDNKIGFKKTR